MAGQEVTKRVDREKIKEWGKKQQESNLDLHSNKECSVTRHFETSANNEFIKY
jgi:hypothetical protein